VRWPARVAGLILAAGEGRRFGGPKQLAELRGRPLLEHPVRAMLGVPALRPVVVVLGAAAAEVRAGVDLRDVEVVVCPDWAEGQAASVRSGVRALGDEADAALVTLGDQPFITPQVIAAVLDRADGDHDAVRATYDGRPGHPVLLARALLDRVDELRGDVGFRDLLAGARVRSVECGHLGDPTDVDTRAALEALRRFRPGRPGGGRPPARSR
jgi:CTP:molybdopterin cytidylyltransferase MocA